VCVCVYSCSTYYQAVRVGGGPGGSGGHVLGETATRDGDDPELFGLWSKVFHGDE
jgi:hypothetical protein